MWSLPVKYKYSSRFLDWDPTLNTAASALQPEHADTTWTAWRGAAGHSEPSSATAL